jgi:hypothetical protein
MACDSYSGAFKVEGIFRTKAGTRQLSLRESKGDIVVPFTINDSRMELVVDDEEGVKDFDRLEVGDEIDVRVVFKSIRKAGE